MPPTLVSVAAILVISLSLMGCDKAELVVVQNKTDQTLVVYEDTVSCDSDTCDQSTLAERTLTWEELTRAAGITLVVQ